jgi:hypothetical protein
VNDLTAGEALQIRSGAWRWETFGHLGLFLPYEKGKSPKN